MVPLRKTYSAVSTEVHKSYCTPEAYRGETCWLFHNRGNGTFEDVTASSGIFDTARNRWASRCWTTIAMAGQPLVTNDTQPNKLYRNLRNGTFKDVGVEAGVAFSNEGKARAGMGVDVADFEGSGVPGIAITNFDDEMIGLYRALGNGMYEDVAIQAVLASPRRTPSGSVVCSRTSISTAPRISIVANGHIDETVRNIRGNVGYAQPPQLFLNNGHGAFRDAAAQVGESFAQPIVGRGLCYGDFDRDGDLDLLITTNNSYARLFRNDQLSGNRSIRFRLIGTKSNRDAIGARVEISNGGASQSRMVKTGSSYLSQSELPVTFGLGKRDRIERVVIGWPSGRTEEYKDLAAGKLYECTEGKGVAASPGF